jgi:6-phosphogluconate dehydrogenase
MWRGGCIIRSRSAKSRAFDNNAKLSNLMPTIISWRDCEMPEGLAKCGGGHGEEGIPVPAPDLAFTTNRSAVLRQSSPGNAITSCPHYERRTSAVNFHTNWTGRGGITASGTYTV